MSIEKKDLPPTEEHIDSNGIKTIITYKYNKQNQVVKVTKRIQMVEKKEQILERVAERRKIVPFGLPSGGNEGVTVQAVEDIFMEKLEQTAKEEKPKKPEGIVCKFCKGNHLSFKCPFRDQFERKEEVKEAPPARESDNTSGNKYVPPSLRNKMNTRTTDYRDEDEGYSVRVSNVAEDVTEYEFKQLFRGYNTSKIRLITDFTTKRCKGYGFLTFMDKEEADRAIAEVNGYALNHLILNLAYAEKKKSTTPRYATGYGRALPQNMRR